MKKIIARCGLECSACPAFLARLNDDGELRRRTAQEWSEVFTQPFTPADINCDGCLSAAGQRTPYCAVCAVRICAEGRGMESCARCAAFACEQLEVILAMEPACRERLEAIRAGGES